MNTHIENPNLCTHHGSTYQGYAVYQGKGQLIVSYLDQILATLDKAVREYPRTFAARVDLHFPLNGTMDKSNRVISSFIESLKAKINHDRAEAAKVNGRAHKTRLRYVWVREYGRNGNPHYHLLILLNNDAYCRLGSPAPGSNNLFSRLTSAWASALGISEHDSTGLVERPENSEYSIFINQDPLALANLIYRVSYFAKVKSKNFRDGNHCFGCSRI